MSPAWTLLSSWSLGCSFLTFHLSLHSRFRVSLGFGFFARVRAGRVAAYARGIVGSAYGHGRHSLANAYWVFRKKFRNSTTVSRDPGFQNFIPRKPPPCRARRSGLLSVRWDSLGIQRTLRYSSKTPSSHSLTQARSPVMHVRIQCTLIPN